MSNAREVVLFSGVRTAIGRYGGSLKDHPPSALAAAVVREAVARAGVDPTTVGHVVFGHVIHTDPTTCTWRAWPPSRAGSPSRRRR